MTNQTAVIDWNLTIPALTFYCVAMLVGLVGNSLAIFIVSRKYKPSTYKTFILGLAYFDITGCCTFMPLAILLHSNVVHFTEVLCKLYMFWCFYCCIGSTTILALIAHERYRRICKPLKRQFTVKQTKLAILSIFCLTSLASTAPKAILVHSDDLDVGIDRIKCIYEENTLAQIYNWYLRAIFFLYLCIVPTFYVCIWRSLKARDKQNFTLNRIEGNNRSEKFSRSKSCINTKRGIIPLTITFKNNRNSHTSKMNGEACPTRTGSEIPVVSSMKFSTNNSDSSSLRDFSMKCDVDNVDGRELEYGVHNQRTALRGERRLRTAIVTNEREAQTSSIKSNLINNSTYILDVERTSCINSKNEVQTYRIARTFGVITVVMIVSYVPTLTLLYLQGEIPDFWVSMSPATYTVAQLCFEVYFISAVSNPLIYTFTDPRFRSHLGNLCRAKRAATSNKYKSTKK